MDLRSTGVWDREPRPRRQSQESPGNNKGGGRSREHLSDETVDHRADRPAVNAKTIDLSTVQANENRGEENNVFD